MSLSVQLFDFSDPASIAGWAPINDAVMGGVSAGELRYDGAGYALFTGHVSFQNNGGFASVRCHDTGLGQQGVVAYVLKVRGDGKRYKLTLRCDGQLDGVSYQAHFEAPRGDWTQQRLATTAFSPTWRGRAVPDAPPLDPARVRQMGLMIADRQEGPFALALRSVAIELV